MNFIFWNSTTAFFAIVAFYVFTFFAEKIFFIFEVDMIVAANHTISNTRIMDMNCMSDRSIYGKIHILVSPAAVIIHGIGSEIYGNITFFHPRISTFRRPKSAFIIIIAKTAIFGKLLKPSRNILTQPGIIIRVCLNIGNEFRMDDKKLTPNLRVPVVLQLMSGMLEVCDDNVGRVHHFYGASSIAALIHPLHTAIPAFAVITHGHIIKGVDRQAESTLGLFGSHCLGMGLAYSFPAIQIIFFRQLAQDSSDFSTGANLKSFLVRKRNDSFFTLPGVLYQGLYPRQIRINTVVIFNTIDVIGMIIVTEVSQLWSFMEQSV